MAKRRRSATGAVLPPWHDVLNNQVWLFRKRVNLIGWVLISGVVVLVGLEVWRVLR